MSILTVKSLSRQFAMGEAYAVKQVSFEAEQGELFALVGESGSGKTTLLRLIAGLEEPDDGQLFINQREVASRKRSVVPEKRSVGMVFQDYALFPHLTVRGNIAYGLHRLTKKDRDHRVEEVMEMVNLQPFGKKYPYEISGGQQQRTALARSLAPKPSIVLLDEPFSNLDDIMKDRVREDVRAIVKQTNTTAVFVTHDTRDALSTADRIAVLRAGEIQQIGTPPSVYHRPVNEYVAGFFGKINVLEATVTNEGYSFRDGLIEAPSDYKTGTQLKLMVRPEDIQIVSKAEADITGKVSHSFYFGSYQQVVVDVAGSPIILRTANTGIFVEGQQLFLAINRQNLVTLTNS
jgi:iron(III) transport system ATP-binding protein